MSEFVKPVKKSEISVTKQTIAAFIAIVSAVVLPQLVHIAGAATGTHTALGEVFLPMHLPVILVGLIAGSYAGAAAGIISPVLSCIFTGMPMQAMLPSWWLSFAHTAYLQAFSRM